MIFSELYSAYYNAVAEVLKAAVSHPLGKDELRAIVARHAFGESMLTIEPALTRERWQLLLADGSTPLVHPPALPLTTLEKRWFKAIYADPRIRLFTDGIPDLGDVEPLFGPRDICVFDRYADGDPYEDERYIRRFRLILAATRDRQPLRVELTNRKGGVTRMVLTPEYLEYSEKDDKFRLIGSGCRYGDTVNLGRIIRCRPTTAAPAQAAADRPKTAAVTFELTDRRNALERVLMHFAHFEKEAVRLDGDRYRVTVTYDRDDETEMVIRLLSFGPVIRVTAPEHFAELIRDRLIRQMDCGL